MIEIRYRRKEWKNKWFKRYAEDEKAANKEAKKLYKNRDVAEVECKEISNPIPINNQTEHEIPQNSEQRSVGHSVDLVDGRDDKAR